MKLIHTSLLALALLLPVLTAGHPTARSPEGHQPHKHHWSFDLFHNKHCIGTIVTYEGYGSTGCRPNIENDGAESFINLKMDPGCKVKLFRDKRCSRYAMIEEVKTGSHTKCKTISRKKTAHSFEVSCR
ncbi:hypothetical protein N7447_007152 [Penicillium robsamsonii]|uniref:uncharacterized protein n=1 Tax=Penicillium robsamsonii TaxID=1792511 RepID=UPI0025496FD9|nr:uncharacterized protein N7447_007152 [Penicillium robsamsonii]KAJ5824812.1 hypothetical protein N7447_007152 [Penicillium robsamsonii]